MVCIASMVILALSGEQKFDAQHDKESSAVNTISYKGGWRSVKNKTSRAGNEKYFYLCSFHGTITVTIYHVIGPPWQTNRVYNR